MTSQDIFHHTGYHINMRTSEQGYCVDKIQDGIHFYYENGKDPIVATRFANNIAIWQVQYDGKYLHIFSSFP